MNKTTLITGSTDGIGKATALAMAKKGYTIHVLGRNEERGKKVLKELKLISNKPHQLFLVDLSTTKSIIDFLDKYTAEFKQLDVLILNALAFPKKAMQTKEGFELTFAVGYISRYIFSILLEPILQNTVNSRVIHIGQGSKAGIIDFESIKNLKNIGKEYSLMDKAKVTLIPYIADGTFTHFVNRENHLQTPHEYYHPGMVDTQQVKESPKFIQWIGKLIGEIIQPEESGRLLADHIENTTSNEISGKYYSKGRLKKTSNKMKNAIKNYNELIEFSENETGIKIK